MEVVYQGPVPAVDVYLPSGDVQTVAKGEPVTFPSSVAESLAASGDWKIKSKSTAAKSGKE